MFDHFAEFANKLEEWINYERILEGIYPHSFSIQLDKALKLSDFTATSYIRAAHGLDGREPRCPFPRNGH